MFKQIVQVLYDIVMALHCNEDWKNNMCYQIYNKSNCFVFEFQFDFESISYITNNKI